MLFLWYFSSCSSCNFFEGFSFYRRENHSQIVKIFSYRGGAPNHLERFRGVSTSPPLPLKTCHALVSPSATLPGRGRRLEGTRLCQANGDDSSRTGRRGFSSADEEIQSRELKVPFLLPGLLVTTARGAAQIKMKQLADSNSLIPPRISFFFFFHSTDQRLEHFSSLKCFQ